MSKVAVLTINYHSKDFLESLKKSLDKQITNFDWSLHIRDNDEDNIGYGRAINELARKLQAEYFLIINPDVEFTKTDSLQKMVDRLDSNPRIGILGPKTIDKDGRIQWSFDKKPSLLRMITDKPLALIYKYWGSIFLCQLLLKKMSPKYDYLVAHDDIDWISGAIMMIRADCFKRADGFDPNFFMYFEDVDLCLRVKSLSMNVVYDPSIEIKHYVGQSHSDNKSKTQMYYKSQDYFLQKHNNAIDRFFVTILRIPYQLLNLKYFINRY